MSNSSDAKFEKLTQTSINKLIPRVAIPSMITMLITSIYNMADTYFVSQLSQSASGAVGIIYSLMTIIQTIGFAVSMGCGITISNELGNQNKDYAENVQVTGFVTMAIVGVIITILGFVFLEEMIMFLGSTETILPYAKIYARFILISAPFMTTSYVLNASLRAQGNAVLAMVGLGIGSILNIFLNPILMFGFNMGIYGAGLATMIGQIISFSILFYQCNSKEESLSVNFKKFNPDFNLYKRILKAGTPNFFRQGLASLSSIILNVLANPFGDPAIAAISIVSRIMMFINSAFIGYGQGFQTVSGYNYGAKKYDRVLQAFWFTLKSGVIAVTFLGCIGVVFSNEIISFFRKGDLEVIEIGAFMLKLQCLALPLQAINTVLNMFTQCIGYSFRATLLAMTRQGIFLLPFLIIFTQKLGLLGIQIAQPVADIFAVMLSVCIVKSVLRDVINLRDLNNEEKNVINE